MWNAKRNSIGYNRNFQIRLKTSNLIDGHQSRLNAKMTIDLITSDYEIWICCAITLTAFCTCVDITYDHIMQTFAGRNFREVEKSQNLRHLLWRIGGKNIFHEYKLSRIVEWKWELSNENRLKSDKYYSNLIKTTVLWLCKALNGKNMMTIWYLLQFWRFIGFQIFQEFFASINFCELPCLEFLKTFTFAKKAKIHENRESFCSRKFVRLKYKTLEKFSPKKNLSYLCSIFKHT